MTQSNPYSSFTHFKKYMSRENAIPVPQRVHLLSEDLELYTGNNMQLKSIQGNKLTPKLNHLSGQEWLNFGVNILTGVQKLRSGQTAAAQQSAAQAAAEQQAAKTAQQRKNLTIGGIAFGVVLLIAFAIAAIKR